MQFSRHALRLVFAVTLVASATGQELPTATPTWQHGTRIFPDGKKGEIWISHDFQVFALVIDKSVQLVNGRERAKYSNGYRGTKITKCPVSADWSPPPPRADGPRGLGHWLYGVEPISQQRRTEIAEDGKKWIEYDVLMHFGSVRHKVRVDPAKGGLVSFGGYTFETVADGPRDIYDLGLSRDAVVEDLMPGPELAKVLDAMAASRKLLGDFRMYRNDEGSENIVWRKGERWRLDTLLDPEVDRGEEPLAGPQRERWWNDQLASHPAVREKLCDGLQVFINKGRGKLPIWEEDKNYGVLQVGGYSAPARDAYPDLQPQKGGVVEFVLKPTTGPKGCVLYKCSHEHTGGARGHAWCYLDPERGYSVVRKEYFDAPLKELAPNPEISAKVDATAFDGYERSPRGYWYPTVCRTERTDRDPATGVRSVSDSRVTYFHFDFPENLPDTLFAIEPPPKP